MPIDGNEFTLGLLDQTALSGWNSQALQAALVDDHADPPEDADTGTISPLPRSGAIARRANFRLVGERDLARGWPARARDNIAAILLSKALEQTGRIPFPEEQAQSLRFTGFSAIELAQNCFCRPGEGSLRPGWEEIGTALEAAVAPAEYAANRSWSPAWAPACSSPSCRMRWVRVASSPASNTTRSPPVVLPLQAAA